MPLGAVPSSGRASHYSLAVAENLAPVPTSRRPALFSLSRLALLSLDGVLAYTLLAVALALAACAGISHARAQPIYGPIDEIYHVGYIERVADSGLPPVRGRDAIVAAPTNHVGSGDVVIGRTQAGGFPQEFHDGARVPQVEVIQPPLYYYALAPVALVFDLHREVFALRAASVAFVLLAIVFLFLAVRVTAPGRPLAAGLAAVILGTMSGLTYALSQVQNDALLMAMFALVFWLLCRDITRRQVSYWLAGGVGGLAITQILAAPFAGAAILVACGLALGRRPTSLSSAVRFALPRLALAATPMALWVGWNVYQYHSLLPGDVTAGAGGAAGLGPSVADLLPLATRAVTESYKDFWSFGFLPGNGDPRPAPLLCFALGVSAVALLLSPAIGEYRLGLAAWTLGALAAFVSTFGTLFLAAVRSGGELSYPGRYFVGVAVAWAALVAVAIDAACGQRVWIARTVSVAFTLVLVRFALQYSTLSFRL
jgi:Dolichyl-phosphate-mannose-protein mannosyltransferase